MSAAEKLDLVPDLADARALFADLDQIHLVAINPLDRDAKPVGRDFGTDIETAVRWAARANADGCNVYWTVNAVETGLHKKPAEKDMTAARFVHVDIDPPKDGTAWSRDEALAALRAHRPEPSFVINSGNGLQAFWRLGKPVENWQHAKDVNDQLRHHFGGDACHNIDRLMRVPGFVNYPDTKKAKAGRVPQLAGWVDADDGVVYELEQLRTSLPPVPPKAPEKGEPSPAAPPSAIVLHTADTLNLWASHPLRKMLESCGEDRSQHGHRTIREAVRWHLPDNAIFGMMLNPAIPAAAHYVDKAGARGVGRSLAKARASLGIPCPGRLIVPDIPRSEAGLGDQAKPRDRNTGFKFLQVGQLDLSPPEFLVDELVEVDSLGLLFGDPGSAKSFFAVDIAASVSTGTPFHGREVKQGPVAYIAGEGHRGMARRFAAWAKDRGVALKDAPLFKSMRAARFLEPGSAAEVGAAVRSIAEQHGLPRLIIIDTLARNFGPGDENSTKDMAGFIDAMDELRSAFRDSVVLIVHHSGHAEKGRARGASNMKGALDFEYQVEKSELQVRVINRKMKDAEPPIPLAFELRPVDLGDGMGSAVLRATTAAPEQPKRPTRAQALAQSTYIEAAIAGGIWEGGQLIGVPREEWREAFYRKHSGESPDAKRKAFNRVLPDLQGLGRIIVEDDVFRWNDPAIMSTIAVRRNGGTSGT